MIGLGIVVNTEITFVESKLRNVVVDSLSDVGPQRVQVIQAPGPSLEFFSGHQAAEKVDTFER